MKKIRLEELEELKKSKKSYIIKGAYVIYQVPAARHATDPSTPEFHFLARRLGVDPIGQGAFGKVYVVHPVDPQTGRINFNKPFVQKSIRQGYDAKEVELFERYYDVLGVIEGYETHDVFMEYLPGNVLAHYERGRGVVSDPIISSLNFQERVHLIHQLVLGFNLLHHNTPTTGVAVVHTDVKPGNIHVTDKDAYPLDFGLSADLVDENQQITHESGRGSAGYRPPEFFEDVKQNVALNPIFMPWHPLWRGSSVRPTQKERNKIILRNK